MRGIVAGGVLMTAPFWSLAVTMIGVWRSFALLEKERAPDPEELQEIAQLSLVGWFVAVGAFVVGMIAVLGSALAIARRRASAAVP